MPRNKSSKRKRVFTGTRRQDLSRNLSNEETSYEDLDYQQPTTSYGTRIRKKLKEKSSSTDNSGSIEASILLDTIFTDSDDSQETDLSYSANSTIFDSEDTDIDYSPPPKSKRRSSIVKKIELNKGNLIFDLELLLKSLNGNLIIIN